MSIKFDTPAVMGIVNVTPDSFYDGCRATESSAVMQRAEQVIAQGADIVDIGGYSTRPNAEHVSEEKETERVLMGIKAVRRINEEIAVSVDTFRAAVVRRAVSEFGKIIVNDISSGDFDDEMIDTAASLGLPYIAMHRRGSITDMHTRTGYANIVEEVAEYLCKKIDTLKNAGIDDIILDAGFGFSKTVEENFLLLNGLHRVVSLGYPVLSGISRKSMIYKTLGCTPQEALTGTTALHWECLRQGSAILRVHDVRQAKEVVKLYGKFMWS